MDQYVERFWYVCIRQVVALDDGLVGFGAALRPGAFPDFGAEDYGVGIDRIDANFIRSEFGGIQSAEVQLGGFCCAVCG